MSSGMTSKNDKEVESIPVVAVGGATVEKVDVDLEDDVEIEMGTPTTANTTTLSDDENSASASACCNEDRVGSDEEGQSPAFTAEEDDIGISTSHGIDVDENEKRPSDTDGIIDREERIRDRRTVLTTEQGHDNMVAKIEDGSMSDTNTDHDGDLEANPTQSSSHHLLSLSRAFFCPITQKMLRDPVVAPDGITYERQAILQRDGGKLQSTPLQDPTDGNVLVAEDNLNQHYPNRALQQVLAERQRLLLSAVGGEEDDSIRSKLLRLQKNIMTTQLGRMLEQVNTTTTNSSTTTMTKRRSLPEAYYCPITFGLMHDPVIDPDGNTFERRSIQLWIRANHTSPLSRRPLEESQLYDNTALRQIMQDEAECSDASIHPSIQKWKDEPTPEPLPVEVSFANSNIEARTAELEALRQQEIFQTKLWCIFSVCFLILMVYVIPSSGIVLAMIYIAFVCCYTNIPDDSGRRATHTLLVPQ